MITGRGAATPALNAVARGDLRARLGTHRGIWVQTFYLIACGLFLLLSLPPEIGRFELRESSLLLAFLVVQLGAVTYLSSAFASSELALDGEKALPDLALSAFSPTEVAVGKAESSVAYACYLTLLGLPIVALAAGLRGTPLSAVAWAGCLTVAVSTASGIWGAYLGGRFASDFSRSFLHWTLLAAVFVGTARLPAPWNTVNPVILLDGVLRGGASWAVPAAIAGYVIAAGAGTALIVGHVRAARAEPEEI